MKNSKGNEKINADYSDSLIPIGIGTSFVLLLILFLSAGAAVGYLLEDYAVFPQAGGVVLLIIFVFLMLIPVLYNKRRSPFERNRVVLTQYDGIGTIQGLRGAMFRLIVYEDGMELRAFYHRYFIPYDKIKKITIEERFISKRLNIESGIAGVPDYIISADKKFWEVADQIMTRLRT